MLFLAFFSHSLHNPAKEHPFFQMRKLQLREVNSLTQGHTAQPVVKPGGAYCLWSLWSCQVQVCGLIQAGCLDVTRKAC